MTILAHFTIILFQYFHYSINNTKFYFLYLARISSRNIAYFNRFLTNDWTDS